MLGYTNYLHTSNYMAIIHIILLDNDFCHRHERVEHVAGLLPRKSAGLASMTHNNSRVRVGRPEAEKSTAIWFRQADLAEAQRFYL